MLQDIPRLILRNECDIEIRLKHPTCIPKCTTKINNYMIDLRPLRNIYHVFNSVGNFSIGLCGSYVKCGQFDSVSTCLITSHNETLPLSGSTETMQYNDKQNIIMMRGKFKENRMN